MSTKTTKQSPDKAKKINKLEKENTNMKKPIILTVVVTVFTIAVLGGMFYLGMTFEHGINERVVNEAKSLAIAVPSKQ